MPSSANAKPKTFPAKPYFRVTHAVELSKTAKIEIEIRKGAAIRCAFSIPQESRRKYIALQETSAAAPLCALYHLW
jgi:hypothetical protein